MYKKRNIGRGNGMWGTRGMGECYILGNVAKHSGDCPQTFRGVLPSILGNIAKYSGECCQTFQEMLPIFRVKGSVVFRILSNIHDRALLRK